MTTGTAVVPAIADLCAARGIYIDLLHWERGGDTICIGAPSNGVGWIIYDTSCGRFWGKTSSGSTYAGEAHGSDAPWLLLGLLGYVGRPL